MSGHSKWANIKHKKAASDKRKGRVFSRLGKEIMIAVKTGGSDATANPRLRTALNAAKSVNMPNANVDRAIKKGAGELGGATFEEIVYEGYAPGGAALIVECLTDNRNRTASDVRSIFDKNNGNLSGSGAVMWMFSRKARFVIMGENANEEKLMEIVIDPGAESIEVDEDVAEVWGPAEKFDSIAKALEEAGIKTEESGIVQKPSNTVGIKEPGVANQILRLVDTLEEYDDVQAVYSNFDIASEILDSLEQK
ncbi:MAG: transcriptional regulator [Lentisphaerae bacterium GWF2_44_16]|nr:MAG: transcriptional regulator [Lentisphaerae bacterium GWF2_44_16]